jgi:hypothetical protein
MTQMTDKPSFVLLGDAVDFTARALEAGEFDGLLDACIGRRDDFGTEVRNLLEDDEPSQMVTRMRKLRKIGKPSTNDV